MSYSTFVSKDRSRVDRGSFVSSTHRLSRAGWYGLYPFILSIFSRFLRHICHILGHGRYILSVSLLTTRGKLRAFFSRYQQNYCPAYLRHFVQLTV